MDKFCPLFLDLEDLRDELMGSLVSGSFILTFLGDLDRVKLEANACFI
jgi:hypothetical protein